MNIQAQAMPIGMQAGEVKTLPSWTTSALRVHTFCELTTETNAVHLNRCAAQAAGFDDLVVPGAYIIARIAAAISSVFGDGTIFCSAEKVQFYRPLLADQQAHFELNCASIGQARHGYRRVALSIKCKGNDGKTLAEAKKVHLRVPAE